MSLNPDDCEENLKKLSSVSCDTFAQMPHSDRVGLIALFDALNNAIDHVRTHLCPNTPLSESGPREFTPESETWKNQNGAMPSKESLAVALAARFSPHSTCPSGELPVRTYQFSAINVPWTAQDTLLTYDSWLRQVFETSGLSRGAELAWVRAAERGVTLSSSHGDEQSIARDKLFEYFRPKLRTFALNDEDNEEASATALNEFNTFFLGTNHEIFSRPLKRWLYQHLAPYRHPNSQVEAWIPSAIQKLESFNLDCLDGTRGDVETEIRKTVELAIKDIPAEVDGDQVKTKVLAALESQLNQIAEKLRVRRNNQRDRYAAIPSLKGFLEMMANRRLQKLRYTLTPTGLDGMKASGVPIELLNRLNEFVGRTWITLELCSQALRKTMLPDDWLRFSGCILDHIDRQAPKDRTETIPPDPVSIASHNPNGEASRVRLIDAILDNELPDGGDIRAVVGVRRMLAIILSDEHWDGCQCRQRWQRPPLTDLQKARLIDYSVLCLPALQIAEENDVDKGAIAQSLFSASRKIRCCLTTILGAPFAKDSLALLKAYDAATYEFQKDPAAYARTAEKLSERDFRQPGRKGLFKKPFPLPGAGLLGMVFSAEEVAQICQSDSEDDDIAVAYHDAALKLTELSTNYGHRTHFQEVPKGSKQTDLFQTFLEQHWLKILPNVAQAVKDNESEE